MSGALIPFEANGWKVRALEIDGEPWFVASDVAKALGYTNPQKAVRDHCKGVNETVHPSRGGDQKMKIIPERDVYRLIMRSRLPEAERFEEWVVGEVLPQIRRTGSYTPQVPQTFAEALRKYADLVEEREVNRPKIEFFDAVASSKDAVEMKHVAKVLDMGVGRNRLFSFLRDHGVLMADNTPYQEYVDRGYFRVVEQKWTTKDGETRISFKTLVYQRGVEYIRRLLRREAMLERSGLR